MLATYRPHKGVRVSVRFKRVLTHLGLYAASAVLLLAASFGLEVLSPATGLFALGTASFAVSALSVTLYPIVACVVGAILTIVRYCRGDALEVPLLAKAMPGVAAVAGVADSGNPGDALVRGAVAHSGLKVIDAREAGCRETLIARLGIDVLGCTVGVLALCMMAAPDGHRESFIWAIFIVVAVAACIYGSILPSRQSWTWCACAACAGGRVASEADRGLRGNPPRSPAVARRCRGAAAVAPHNTGVPLFARDDELRRRYVRLPKFCGLGAIGFITIVIVAGSVLPESMRGVASNPLVGFLLIALMTAAMFGFVPLLGWWMVCSGRSLTQEIVLADGGALTYSITSGSGPDVKTTRFDLSSIDRFSIGSRCLHVRCRRRANGPLRHLWIPRTFSNEGRFVEELRARIPEASAHVERP